MREKIIEALKSVKGDQFDDTEHLVTGGWISSFDLLYLVRALEQKLEIKIPLEAITPEEFDSLTAIENFIKRLKEA